jgi:hypothetical protein
MTSLINDSIIDRLFSVAPSLPRLDLWSTKESVLMSEAYDIAVQTVIDEVSYRGSGSAFDPIVIDGIIARKDGEVTKEWVAHCRSLVVGE